MATKKSTTGTGKRTTKTAATKGNGHTATTVATPAPATDFEGAIRVRAFQLFQERGGHPGRELEDWLRAEAEVLAQRAVSKS